ncbi:unannotated protein [freshwater metagenome]|uniref:FAD:protein FMN transferase n=1 Tax=freshwater metagenome TaxID=449393 RepID=A0A6J7DQV8_9ZZZZ
MRPAGGGSRSFVFPTMGTMASLAIASHVGVETADAAARACVDSLAGDERRFSHYSDSSDIERWRRGEPIDAKALHEIRVVLDECLLLEIASDGVFSVTNPGTGRLDTAGYVKGHAIGKAAEAIRHAGVDDFSLNVGGDTYCGGQPAPDRAWRIGVAHPHRSRGVAAVVEVRDGAVATSGIAQRGDHIWHVRPSQALAPSRIVSFTVTGPDIATADAYATIGFAMGERGIAWVNAHEGFGSLAIRADGRMTGDAPGLLAG